MTTTRTSNAGAGTAARSTASASSAALVDDWQNADGLGCTCGPSSRLPRPAFVVYDLLAHLH